MQRPIDPFDCLLIIFTALMVALVSEDQYKKLIAQVKELKERTYKLKEQSQIQKLPKTHQRKYQQYLKDLKAKDKAISSARMKGTFFGILFIFSTMSILNKYYYGIVVAKLPFQPPSFIRSLTHRNLNGTDYTECGMNFIYALATMVIKPLTNKLLGFEPPKGIQQSPKWFQQPQEEQ